MKAIAKFQLKMGKLNIPLSCYKAVDNTMSIRAKEVAKINGKIYPIFRKPYYIDETGSHKDIDKSQILKSYEKDDGETALFTKDEQSQLLKKGSSREWDIKAVIDKNKFNELSFQKDGVIAEIELEKNKELINKKNLKFFAMLKQGLSDKAIITQVLWKNIELPVLISNYGNKLLVRFLHYKDEIREIEGQELPKLNKEEIEKASSFIKQFYQPEFDVSSFENKTEEKVRKIIESRGTEIEEVKMEDITEEDPFDIEV